MLIWLFVALKAHTPHTPSIFAPAVTSIPLSPPPRSIYLHCFTFSGALFGRVLMYREIKGRTIKVSGVPAIKVKRRSGDFVIYRGAHLNTSRSVTFLAGVVCFVDPPPGAISEGWTGNPREEKLDATVSLVRVAYTGGVCLSDLAGDKSLWILILFATHALGNNTVKAEHRMFCVP